MHIYSVLEFTMGLLLMGGAVALFLKVWVFEKNKPHISQVHGFKNKVVTFLRYY